MTRVQWPHLKSFIQTYGLTVVWAEDAENYYLYAQNGLTLDCVLHKETNTEEIADFEANFKAASKLIKPAIEVTKLPESQPFAEPTYRTKHQKREGVITVSQGDSENIDYIMPIERYASGGTIIVKNPQFGDWIEAQICDDNGSIPEAYRAAICEAWPIVATYIEGQYIEITDSNSILCKQGIDTRPLVAKISPGLILRVIYHADGGSEGSPDREVLVNYFLAKKLV